MKLRQQVLRRLKSLMITIVIFMIAIAVFLAMINSMYVTPYIAEHGITLPVILYLVGLAVGVFLIYYFLMRLLLLTYELYELIKSFGDENE